MLDEPLWVTEGCKKADAAVSHGLCCITLMGVSSFKVGDWKYIALKGRRVNVCFDSDVMTKPEVGKQLDSLCHFLHEQGAKVYQIILPTLTDQSKTGLDDFLKAQGKQSLDEIVTNAQEWMPVNPFLSEMVWANNLPEPEEPKAIFPGLYPGSVTLLNGESGAGKSTLLYTLMVYAALNKPVFDVRFGLGRPARVLYLDPETPNSLRAKKLARITKELPSGLAFVASHSVDLSDEDQQKQLRILIAEQAFDIVVLDPIANLFNTDDENNNAEASRQMKYLTGLSRDTGACIVAVHHMGKTQDNAGRGASARRAAADCAIAFRSSHDTEADDTFQPNGLVVQFREEVCRYQIFKNRFGETSSLYLKKLGEDKFGLSTNAEWKKRRTDLEKGPDQTEKAKDEIILLLGKGGWHDRQSILTAINKEKEGIGKNSIGDALVAMEAAKQIKSKPGKGTAKLYSLPQPSQ